MSPTSPRYRPACDFQVGEAVWFPVVGPADGLAAYQHGTVHSVHDAKLAKKHGNLFNMVVLFGDTLFPTHSNLVRKTLEGL